MVREKVRFHDLQVFKWDKHPVDGVSQNNFFFFIRKPLENEKQSPIPYRFHFDSGCLSSKESIEQLTVQAAESTKQFIDQENINKLAAVISKYLDDNFNLYFVASPNSAVTVLIAVAVDRASGRGPLVKLLRGLPQFRLRSDVEFTMRLRGLTSTEVEAPIAHVTNLKVFMRGYWTGPCAIYMEDFAWEFNAMWMPCNHVFHARCIARWLWFNTSCPLCRSRLI